MEGYKPNASCTLGGTALRHGLDRTSCTPRATPPASTAARPRRSATWSPCSSRRSRRRSRRHLDRALERKERTSSAIRRLRRVLERAPARPPVSRRSQGDLRRRDDQHRLELRRRRRGRSGGDPTQRAALGTAGSSDGGATVSWWQNSFDASATVTPTLTPSTLTIPLTGFAPAKLRPAAPGRGHADRDSRLRFNTLLAIHVTRRAEGCARRLLQRRRELEDDRRPISAALPVN